MKVAVFSAKPYDQEFCERANRGRHELVYYPSHLNRDTALLASGCQAVCCFVNDRLDAETVSALAEQGVQLVALRCAGYNQVDLVATTKHNITVVRVPEYSPHAIAEHTLALILMLNRHLHRAHSRIRENDYSLHGLLGFDLVEKTVGVIGTGKIGAAFCRIMLGLGCRVIAHDPQQDALLQQQGVNYVDLAELWPQADIISLHCPLIPATHHLINQNSISQMKDGVMLINTGRGALVDTRAVIAGLKQQKIGYLGLDVYEEEAEIFFEDHSDQLLQDDVFARLLTFPNVVVTGHQAFFTKEALTAIAETTLNNISFVESGEREKAYCVTLNG